MAAAVVLPPLLRKGSGEGSTGNYAAAWGLFASAGVDGIFTDDPALAVALTRSSQP